MDEVTAEMNDVGMSLTAITVESRIVVCHLGIRPAGVEGRQPDRMMRLLSGWMVRERPRVEWVPLMERLISVECPNGLVDRMKLSGGPKVVW